MDLPVIEVFDGHDRLAGCLPKKSQTGEWFPRAADTIRIIPRDQWDEIAQEISLKNRVLKIKDQNGFGACASYASVLSVEIARELAGYPYEELNALSVYGRVNGGRDAGSSIDENLRFIQQRGVVPVRLWPESKGWRANPPEEAWDAALDYRIDEADDIANVDEFVSVLLGGRPVVWGSRGHALCAIAHKKDYPEVANSWDTSWGDEGFGKWDSYNRITWGYGAWSPRVARYSGGDPAPEPIKGVV